MVVLWSYYCTLTNKFYVNSSYWTWTFVFRKNGLNCDNCNSVNFTLCQITSDEDGTDFWDIKKEFAVGEMIDLTDHLKLQASTIILTILPKTFFFAIWNKFFNYSTFKFRKFNFNKLYDIPMNWIPKYRAILFPIQKE